MAHDVFISYSSRDKPIADAVTATLEQRKIRCRVAPRDVLPGALYGESIIDALEKSRAMVLIFSASANTSPQVMREVERAVSKGVTIIPFRIEEVAPSKSMEYFISAPHWLDAWSPPLEAHINRLAEAIQRLLGITEAAPGGQAAPAESPAVAAPSHPAPTEAAPISTAAAATPPPVTAAATAPASRAVPVAAAPAPEVAAPMGAKPKPRWWMIVGGVAALAIMVVVGVLVMRPDEGGTDVSSEALPTAAKAESAGPCSGTSLVIQRGVRGAVADVYIWAAEPGGNLNYDTLYTGTYETGRKQSLIRFDLQEIPRGAQVLKATMHIYFLGSDPPRPVRVHRITREWAEESVTWSSLDGQFDGERAWATIEGGEAGWRDADVTALVRSWVSGDLPNYGLLLDDPDGKAPDEYETYYGSEVEDVERRPGLEICFQP